MPDIHIIPGLWGIDGYTAISRLICDRFDVVPGETYIEFPYDWRRDNRVAARRLRALADEKLHAQRQRNPDAKLVLVGHSMGGLVARYFLECLDGWHDTRMLITFGTPHRGSLNALDFLVNGFVKKVGPLKVADLTDLLRSLTSVYQLLPVYPVRRPGRRVRAGGRDRRPAARRRPGAGGERAEGLPPRDLGRRDAHEPAPTRSTPSSGSPRGRSSPRGGTARAWSSDEIHGGEDHGGDGTVPRVSATPIETDDWQPAYQPMYASDRHASLQNADAVHVQLHGILTPTPDRVPRRAERATGGRRAPRRRREPRPTGAARAGEPHLPGVGHRPGDRAPATPPVTMRRDSDDVHHAEVPPLPPGDYRSRRGRRRQRRARRPGARAGVRVRRRRPGRRPGGGRRR